MSLSSRKIHVISQLKTLPSSTGLTIKGTKAWIRCPFHGGGHERTPSLMVNLTAGKFKEGSWSCFGCGAQADMDGGGTWNNLATALHLQTIGRGSEDEFSIRPSHLFEEDGEDESSVSSDSSVDDDTDDFFPSEGTDTSKTPEPTHEASTGLQKDGDTNTPPPSEQGMDHGEGAEKLKLKARKLLEQLGDSPLMESRIDYSMIENWPIWNPKRQWRGITGPTLTAIGARKAFDPYNRERLWLPVAVNGTLYSSIYCTYTKTSAPSYIYDGSKDIRYAVFPYDHVKAMGMSYVVVVEGSRDALHLIDHGIPAVAILGGNTSWNSDKRDLIMSLDPQLVILAPDPDEVGEKLAHAMMADFKSQYVPVRWYKMAHRIETRMVGGKKREVMKKEEDPGSLPPERLQALKSRAETFLASRQKSSTSRFDFSSCGE